MQSPASGQPAAAELPASLQEARRLFDNLFAQYNSSQIDAQAFERARTRLAVSDGQGGFWTPDTQGRWLYFDGAAWRSAQPPLQPASKNRRPAAVRNVKGHRVLWIVLGVLGTVLLSVVVIATLAWRDLVSAPSSASESTRAATPGVSLPSTRAAIPPALLATPAPLPRDEAPPASDPRLILYDDFEADEGRWPIDANEQRRTGLADGQYTIEVLQPDTGSWRSYGDVGRNAYVVIADVIPLDEREGSQGLLFLQGEDGYYSFDVDMNGRYRLLLRQADAWHEEIPWTSHASLQNGPTPNRLGVMVQNGEIALYANGTRLATVADSAGIAGRPGLFCGSGVDGAGHGAAFDNLRVYAPFDGPAPYTEAQMSLIMDAGLPQSFALVQFETDSGERVRHETWTFHNAGLSYLFEEGQYASWQEAEPLPPSARPSSWRPDQFALGEPPERLMERFPEVSWQSLGDEALFGLPLTLYTDGEVVLGYYEGALVLVHAPALRGEGQ